MTFPARFQTVDLSDFSSSTFRVFDERGGGDGEIKGGVKGTKRREEDKRKGGTAITEERR